MSSTQTFENIFDRNDQRSVIYTPYDLKYVLQMTITVLLNHFKIDPTAVYSLSKFLFMKFPLKRGSFSRVTNDDHVFLWEFIFH